MSHRWFWYREAGTCRKAVKIDDPEAMETSFIVPQAAKGETIHVALEVKDDGNPPLYSYRRIVFTVE